MTEQDEEFWDQAELDRFVFNQKWDKVIEVLCWFFVVATVGLIINGVIRGYFL